MKRILAITLFASVLMLASGAGVKVSAAPTQQLMSEEAVEAALDNLFTARCDVIKGGSPDRLSTVYGATAEAQQRRTYESQYLVKLFVEPYRYNNYVISDCRYELRDLTISANAKTTDVNVQVTPVLFYDWSRPDWNSTVTTSESEGVHRITLQMSGGVPKVVRHEYVDFFGGILPTSAFKPAHVYEGEVTTNGAGAFTPTHKERWSLADKLKEEQRKVSTVTLQSTATYDFVGAAYYASNWALSRNNNYPNYNSDCTNFVSQTIHDSAGGEAPFYVGSNELTNWRAMKDVFGTWGSTKPWRLVIDFRNMVLAGSYGPHGTWVGYPDDLLRGDLMIFKLTGSSEWNHNTIVTSYALDGTPLLSYHTTDTLNRPWNTMPAAAITAVSMDATFNYP